MNHHIADVFISGLSSVLKTNKHKMAQHEADDIRTALAIINSCRKFRWDQSELLKNIRSLAKNSNINFEELAEFIQSLVSEMHQALKIEDYAQFLAERSLWIQKDTDNLLDSVNASDENISLMTLMNLNMGANFRDAYEQLFDQLTQLKQIADERQQEANRVLRTIVKKTDAPETTTQPSVSSAVLCQIEKAKEKEQDATHLKAMAKQLEEAVAKATEETRNQIGIAQSQCSKLQDEEAQRLLKLKQSLEEEKRVLDEQKKVANVDLDKKRIAVEQETGRKKEEAEELLQRAQRRQKEAEEERVRIQQVTQAELENIQKTVSTQQAKLLEQQRVLQEHERILMEERQAAKDEAEKAKSLQAEMIRAREILEKKREFLEQHPRTQNERRQREEEKNNDKYYEAPTLTKYRVTSNKAPKNKRIVETKAQKAQAVINDKSSTSEEIARAEAILTRAGNNKSRKVQQKKR